MGMESFKASMQESAAEKAEKLISESQTFDELFDAIDEIGQKIQDSGGNYNYPPEDLKRMISNLISDRSINILTIPSMYGLMDKVKELLEKSDDEHNPRPKNPPLVARAIPPKEKAEHYFEMGEEEEFSPNKSPLERSAQAEAEFEEPKHEIVVEKSQLMRGLGVIAKFYAKEYSDITEAEFQKVLDGANLSENEQKLLTEIDSQESYVEEFTKSPLNMEKINLIKNLGELIKLIRESRPTKEEMEKLKLKKAISDIVEQPIRSEKRSFDILRREIAMMGKPDAIKTQEDFDKYMSYNGFSLTPKDMDILEKYFNDNDSLTEEVGNTQKSEAKNGIRRRFETTGMGTKIKYEILVNKVNSEDVRHY